LRATSAVGASSTSSSAFRHEAECGNQGARGIAGAVEGADAALVVAGGGGEFVEDFVGSRAVDQMLLDGAVEHAEEGFVRRALQDVVAVFLDVVGQLRVAGKRGRRPGCHAVSCACLLGNAATLEDVCRDEHRPYRRRAAFRFAPGAVGGGEAGEDAGRRLVAARDDVGGVIAVSLEIDVDRHRRVVARGQRIALPDVALRRAVADDRDAEGERHAAVLPDARRGAQRVLVVEKMRRVVGRALNDADARPVGRQAFDDGCLRVIAEPGKVCLVAAAGVGALKQGLYRDRLVGQTLDAAIQRHCDEQDGAIDATVWQAHHAG
jgi:hypothetical protein